MDRPGMLWQGTNDCSTIVLPAITRSIARPVCGPMRRAQDVNLSGDHGESIAACAGGMWSTIVEYRPLRPLSLRCSATTAPSCITVTVESVRRASTLRPISACGTE